MMHERDTSVHARVAFSNASEFVYDVVFSATQAASRVLQGALWDTASPRRQQQTWAWTLGLQSVLLSLMLMPEASVIKPKPVQRKSQIFSSMVRWVTLQVACCFE